MLTGTTSEKSDYNTAVPSLRELPMSAADAVCRRWTQTPVTAALSAAHLQQQHRSQLFFYFSQQTDG